MDLDAAFYSYDQMRVFAEVGIALAEAQMAALPEETPEWARRDSAEPHRVALSQAEEALGALLGQATAPSDLSDVTASAVADTRAIYEATLARAEERLAIAEVLWPVLGIDPDRERSVKATAEAWIAAFDAVEAGV